MSKSNTQRTLKSLRKSGYICDIVERFNVFAGPHGKRYDLFGFLDILAIDPVRGGVVGVQSFGSDWVAHWRKITVDRRDVAMAWLLAGRGITAIELWGWRKVKAKRGGKAMRWAPRIGRVTLDDLVHPLLRFSHCVDNGNSVLSKAQGGPDNGE